MYYETTIKRVITDKKGNDKEVAEKYICDKCELFAEAEHRMLEQFNNECDVTAIKRSPIREFANSPSGLPDEAIYIATIADIFVKDDGSESKTKYKVALYAKSVTEANRITSEYMAQGLDDMECERIEKTSFIEVL